MEVVFQGSNGKMLAQKTPSLLWEVETQGGHDEVAESGRRQCRVMVRGYLVIVLSEPQFPHLSNGDAIDCGEG